MSLQIGDKAPAFTGVDQNGNTIELKDYLGKKIALYFYPKDNTPGCTAQACNLNDNETILQKAGIQVIGVSIDSAESHKKFEQKFHLSFPLIADADKVIVNAYGVWGPKKFMGKEYEGTNRTTFLINEEGKIDHIISKPKTKAHAEEILALWQ